MSGRMRLLWYTRNVSRAHYGMDDDGLFNADCACGVTLAGNEPATFADAERWHTEQVRREPRDRPCGPVLPAGIPGIAPAPDAIAAAEERGRRAGIEERDELRAQVDAARRLLNGTNYLAWANAGGEPECEHGYFIAVPCRACDMALVLTGKARAALAPRDSGKEPDFLAAMDAVRDDLKRKGVRVNTVEMLTELYEGRGHSHEEALRMARGEPDSEDRK